MKKLPIGIQFFKDLIQDDYIYVDKTALIHQLITQGRYYFLSRPRRFGKSLLTTTLEQLFLGEKKLFKGLWIEDKIEWENYPVIRMNMADLDYKTMSLNKAIRQELHFLANQQAVTLPESDSTSDLFRTLLIQLKQQHQKQVVVLIDEYDKPIVDYINDYEQADQNRKILAEFYSVLKHQGNLIHFLLLTGVSKFSKISIFSKLNNLNDLTTHEQYATLLGITYAELLHYFQPYLQAIQEKFQISQEELIDKIKYWYNGYSWDGEQFLYNPFSLLNFFAKKRFEGYWFATGTPTFLIQALQHSQIELDQLENMVVDKHFFDVFSLENPDPQALLFQTGYLTLKSYDWESGEYQLAYPNAEVKKAFLNHVLLLYSNKPTAELGTLLYHLRQQLKKGETELFIRTLQSIFAEVSYHWQPRKKSSKNWVVLAQINRNIRPKLWEGYFHALTYLILRLLGVQVQTEITTNFGRIDAVVQVFDYIYIMEFKLGKATVAMQQIHDKQYYLPYLSSNKKIILVGIGFEEETRNIGTWLVEEMKSN